MAKSTIVQARIDPATKSAVLSILGRLGMPLSQAISIFLRQIVIHRGIPFEIKLPNKVTMEAIEELESGKGVKFATTDELFKDLTH
jgi:DNA-damage-inducible protein J